MSCKLTMALVSEHQEGDVGDTWMYDLEVKVFSGSLLGEATISVPKHDLEPDTPHEPFGSPQPVVIFEGECEEELLLRLELTATEVDLLINDVGKASKDVRLEMPAPGCTVLNREVDISAGVRESPGIRNLNSIFTLRVRFSLEITG